MKQGHLFYPFDFECTVRDGDNGGGGGCGCGSGGGGGGGGGGRILYRAEEMRLKNRRRNSAELWKLGRKVARGSFIKATLIYGKPLLTSNF